MDRRDLLLVTASAAVLPAFALERPAETTVPNSVAARLTADCRALEKTLGGRLGLGVIDTASGHAFGYRAAERFPLCSTFKWLAAAAVLARVDAGEEDLSRRVRIKASDLLEYAPITKPFVGLEVGMSIAQLCEAAVADSDNTASMLLMHSLGGIPAFNRFVRSLGDTSTRLDRGEPDLNEALPGDPRDTTTPKAMARDLQLLLLPHRKHAKPSTGSDSAPGKPPLSTAAREQLTRWMLATRTSDKRLRAGMPPGWQLADKTGTGNTGTGAAGDVGIYWPPLGAPPLVLTVYLAGGSASREAQDAAIAQVGGWVRALRGA